MIDFLSRAVGFFTRLRPTQGSSKIIAKYLRREKPIGFGSLWDPYSKAGLSRTHQSPSFFNKRKGKNEKNSAPGYPFSISDQNWGKEDHNESIIIELGV
jgi:hypothetical protein